MGLSERFRTGEWPQGNRIRTEWHDAGTPTTSQKADAVQKLSGGTPILSRQGSWDELGWSDARKQRERDYFAQEAAEMAAVDLSFLERSDAAAEAAGTDQAV